MGEQPSAVIDGRDIEMKEMGTGLAGYVLMDNRKNGLNDNENVKPLTSKEVENKVDDKKSVLFLSLDILTNDSRACSVDVGMNDLKTMANLRDSYNALRRSFLWKRKCPVEVKFYRVSQISTINFTSHSHLIVQKLPL
jgi:virulence-associated protein VapD